MRAAAHYVIAGLVGIGALAVVPAALDQVDGDRVAVWVVAIFATVGALAVFGAACWWAGHIEKIDRGRRHIEAELEVQRAVHGAADGSTK